MRIAVSLINIKDGAILLVRKGDVWILPGGKPKDGEKYRACLLRECAEELPGLRINIEGHYGCFAGTTPNTGDTLQDQVFLGRVEGDIKPAAEISESGYFRREQFSRMNISAITRNILYDLIQKRHL